jgi:hypothetical protein
VTEKKGLAPNSEISPQRSPEERNIRKQLGRVRRYAAASTNDNMRSLWETHITRYEAQLITAEARAKHLS